MALPDTMRAVKNTAPGKAEVLLQEPLPPLKDDYILVKVHAVALNPTDWKHVDEYPNVGATIGCDFSGVVVAVGSNLSTPWSVGDRVAGMVHGAKQGNFQSGCFADYTTMRSHQGLHIPSGVRDEEAATLGAGVLTIGVALYQMLNLPWPDQIGKTRPSSSIFIYGGSTATGLLAIQFAKLSGLYVITTCSPHNFEKVKSLGADEIFDYHDSDVAAKIRETTGNKLLLAFDTIAEGDSVKICADALTDEQGKASYVATLPYEPVRSEDDVWQGWLYAYTTVGEAFSDMGIEWPARPNDAAHSKRFWVEFEKHLAGGKVKLFPILREGGLSEEGIIAGLEELRQGKVSGGKLVYRVA